MSDIGESFGRITEWAKKNPVLAAGAVGGVVLLAVLSRKPSGDAGQLASDEGAAGGLGGEDAANALGTGDMIYPQAGGLLYTLFSGGDGGSQRQESRQQSYYPAVAPVVAPTSAPRTFSLRDTLTLRSSTGPTWTPTQAGMTASQLASLRSERSMEARTQTFGPSTSYRERVRSSPAVQEFLLAKFGPRQTEVKKSITRPTLSKATTRTYFQRGR